MSEATEVLESRQVVSLLTGKFASAVFHYDVYFLSSSWVLVPLMKMNPGGW